jgi:hypothetical protein
MQWHARSKASAPVQISIARRYGALNFTVRLSAPSGSAPVRCLRAEVDINLPMIPDESVEMTQLRHRPVLHVAVAKLVSPLSTSFSEAHDPAY